MRRASSRDPLVRGRRTDHHRQVTAPDPLPPCLVVAGPTASGKSALALALAEHHRGTIVNADAMQCYRELRVLTARPTPDDEARVPHRLYGTRPAAAPGTAATWREDALAALDEARRDARLPILCGGTGLYLQSLAAGLADIPDPGEAARQEARGILASAGAPALHARLAAVDPRTAARLRPSDGQRLARAFEVWRGTGRPLADWQDAGGAAPAPWRFALVLLRPSRDALRLAISARFDAMLDAGALDEVARLLADNLDPALPAMRAHGVPELASVLRGTLGLDEARRRAIAATLRYTRRQETWFRHHVVAPPERSIILEPVDGTYTQHMESLSHFIGIFLRSPG